MQSQQSQASSSLSQASHQSSMKRSHCHTNLSSLGSSVSSADLGVMSLSNTRRMSSPNDGWGYFADTTARWIWCAAAQQDREEPSPVCMLWWVELSRMICIECPLQAVKSYRSSRDHVLSSPPYAMQWYLLIRPSRRRCSREHMMLYISYVLG